MNCKDNTSLSERMTEAVSEMFSQRNQAKKDLVFFALDEIGERENVENGIHGLTRVWCASEHTESFYIERKSEVLGEPNNRTLLVVFDCSLKTSTKIGDYSDKSNVIFEMPLKYKMYV